VLKDNVTGNGRVFAKRELLNEAGSNDVIYERQEDSGQTVRVWGDTAIVSALLRAEGTDKGAAFDYSVWFSDTDACTPAGWRYVFGQSSMRLPQPP